MPVDYSKWVSINPRHPSPSLPLTFPPLQDALELSDDSDVEVHPNVDKRSFIRAKQNQIHQERQQRKFRIDGLKYEITLHETLLKRISNLVAALKSRAEEAATRSPAEVAFQAVMESAGDPKDDKLPPLPEGIQPNPDQPKSYSQMMAGLLDQVNKALDEKKPDDRYTAMLVEVEQHQAQVKTLIKESGEELAQLQKEEGKKITSDSIHTGFDSSHVNKSKSAGGDSTQVELLNPSFNTSGPSSGDKDKAGSGAGAAADDDEEIEASPRAREFAAIKTSDYAASLRFLGEHPEILTEKETDGLLVLAFDAALEKKDDLARQCVHQALLLQYCRALGKDGVALFFKRITTKGHQAQDVFYRDVQDTYMRIKNRSREIIAERAKEPEGIEQIQLHAVEPGTVIQIHVPPTDSEDPEVQQARQIYDTFKPEMRTALETGELDKVNKVLGDMSIEDAEELVGKFGQAGILSMEEQIIDATTEEGQQQWKEIEKQAAEDKAAKGKETEAYGDPE